MFEAAVYIERRKVLKEKLGGGLLLFLGNEESPMNYLDNTYHFRQDSTFLYFFGIDRPGLSAVIDLDNDREIVFGDELTIDDIVWMGILPTLKAACEQVGIEQTMPENKLASVLRDAFAKDRTIHYLPPYRSDSKIKLQELLGIRPDKISVNASVDFTKAVVAQREIKSEMELTEMRKAADISVDMHVEAIRMARPGMSEAEVAAKINQVPLAQHGNIAFPIIATIHGEILHNHYHGNVLKEGDLFLVDAGAETAMHYAGDLSSTFPVSKKFTEQQKVIYQLTLNAHKAAVEMLKPGVAFKDVHYAASRSIFEGLKSIGLTKGDTESALLEGAHALFFPCGTGHMIGLDVHDMEDLGEVYVGYDGQPKSTQFGVKSLRLAKPLKPGFALTIEPGIYFIPELYKMWRAEKKFESFLNYSEIEKYIGFGGIRNEEDYLITDKGCERIGKYKPMEIDEIEDLRN